MSRSRSPRYARAVGPSVAEKHHFTARAIFFIFSSRIGARVAGLSPAQLCAIIEAQAGASDAALRVAEEHAARLVEQPYFFFIWRSTP